MNRLRPRAAVVRVTLLLAVTLTLARPAAAAEGSGPAMIDAAQKFLAGLNEAGRTTATMPFDDPRRLDWHHVPKPKRKGLQYRDMNEPQRELCHALLRTGFSEAGYAKARTIMSMENNVKEGERVHGTNLTHLRDPLRYFLTIFGTPDAKGTWGWSFEGHHLSVNYVVRDGAIVGDAPNAWGANPATIHDLVNGGPPVGTRPLADEEQRAFDLIASLDDARRAKAIVGAKPPNDLRPGTPRPPAAPPEGCAASDMNEAQRGKLSALIGAYVANLPKDVAEGRLAEIAAEGLENVHFGWWGGTQPGEPHYFRAQGPTFLIELVNIQSDPAGKPANHIHTIWRSMRNDFGVHSTAAR